MSSNFDTSLIAKVVSCVPEAEYEGETFGQSILMQHNNQELRVLDTDKQVDSTHIEMNCRVELLWFLGKLFIQSDNRKSIEVLNPDYVKLHGEIVDFETIPGQIPSPHTDIKMVIDVGMVTLRGFVVYWPGTSIAGDFKVEDLKRGLYVTYIPGRIDLISIVTS